MYIMDHPDLTVSFFGGGRGIPFDLKVFCVFFVNWFFLLIVLFFYLGEGLRAGERGLFWS